MKKQTIGKQKALKDLQDYYEYASNSSVRQQWLNQYLIKKILMFLIEEKCLEILPT